MDMMKDIYWAEKHLVESLPEMQKAATTDELQEAFEDHLLATQKHVSRLEKVFRLLGKEPETKKCEAMAGLVEEAKSIIKETKEGTMTRDVGLIIAAQKVEHYEIATYGSMVQLARTMEKDEIASILEKTLWEEEDTDQF
jgi:ferritin-like metal-binding protein YciE